MEASSSREKLQAHRPRAHERERDRHDRPCRHKSPGIYSTWSRPLVVSPHFFSTFVTSRYYLFAHRSPDCPSDESIRSIGYKAIARFRLRRGARVRAIVRRRPPHRADLFVRGKTGSGECTIVLRALRNRGFLCLQNSSVLCTRTEQLRRSKNYILHGAISLILFSPLDSLESRSSSRFSS